MVFDSCAKLNGIGCNKKLKPVKRRFCTMKCTKHHFSDFYCLLWPLTLKELHVYDVTKV